MGALRAGLAAALALCCALYVIFSRHWPMIGDASMVHYLVLLMQHGMAPYRDIVDAQMPGTYLLDWLVIHGFGGGTVGMRVFDLTLVAVAGCALLWIAWPTDRLAGLFAAALLALLHGRDGIPQTAQRDLIIAVLMLLGYAFAFHAVRRGQAAWMLLFGLCAGVAATIKPTALPLALLLALAVVVLKRRGRPWGGSLAWGIVGLAIPAATVAAFLVEERALPYFFDALRGMWPYYARLDNRPLGYLLLHSVSPLMPLVVLWLLMLAVRRAQTPRAERKPDWERVALWLGLALGMFSYVSQRKGFPYHRYPTLAFLLLLMGLEFSEALRRRGVLRVCGVVGLAAGALIIAPVSTYKISTYDWRHDELFGMLEGDLEKQGGPALSGHVQCLDTYSGCINALYRMDLAESTGFLVDFYFWAPRQTPVTEEMRARFWTAIQQNPPRVFVVMKQDFPNGPDTFGKLQRWPEFDAYLQEHYTLAADRMAQHWVKRESRAYPPTGYRIYVRNDDPAPHA
ncbi:MAG TPA: hypothetical protein VHX60_12475 [Acidobacteriaceae bacterium]|nr:hypothetical protein [Acidobacteriaceae bacterium]